MKNKTLKTALTAALLSTSLSASAATYWTPAVIKASLTNANTVKATAGFISGLNQTFKALQHHGMVDDYLCVPDSVTVVQLSQMVLDKSTRGFPQTSDGGVEFVFYALYDYYPCGSKR